MKKTITVLTMIFILLPSLSLAQKWECQYNSDCLAGEVCVGGYCRAEGIQPTGEPGTQNCPTGVLMFVILSLLCAVGILSALLWDMRLQLKGVKKKK